jgi:hypothetical protein
LSNYTKTQVLFFYELVEKRQGNEINGLYTLSK